MRSSSRTSSIRSPRRRNKTSFTVRYPMEQLFYLPTTMIWPLVACLVLTGIHVYLGVHVIARKVIFVDLALAQIAALGTVIGVLLGYEVGKDSNALYLYSLAF